MSYFEMDNPVFRVEDEEITAALEEIDSATCFLNRETKSLTMESRDGEYLLLERDGYLNEKVNQCTLFTLKDRAGIAGRLPTMLETYDTETFCELVNLGLKCWCGTSTIVKRGEEVIAVHSSKYQAVPQKELFMEISDRMSLRFPDVIMESLDYSHEKTEVRFSLSKHKREICAKYREAYQNSGLPEMDFTEVSPFIKASVSDIGLFSIKLNPMLKVGKFTYPLGEPITMKHNGKFKWHELANNVDNCFSKMETGLNNMVKMLETKLEYPLSVFVRVAEITGLAKNCKKACKAVLETYEYAFRSSEKITGYELFCALQEVKYQDNFSNLGGATKLKIEELLNRLNNIDWEKYDRPGKEQFD